MVGDAATTWDIDATGTIYTFHLRPNMHFSDGTPLTATDFAYSINARSTRISAISSTPPPTVLHHPRAMARDTASR